MPLRQFFIKSCYIMDRAVFPLMEMHRAHTFWSPTVLVRLENYHCAFCIATWLCFPLSRTAIQCSHPTRLHGRYLCYVFITFTAPERTPQLYVDLFLWLSRFSEKANKPQGLQLMVPCLGLLKAIWLVSRIFLVHKVLQLCKISLQHNKTLSGKTHQAVRSLDAVRQFSGSINLAIKM